MAATWAVRSISARTTSVALRERDASGDFDPFDAV